MKLSARNQFSGRVTYVEKGAVNGIVHIEISPGIIVTADITNAAIDELELEEGKSAVAVIKASNVMVGIE